MPDLLWTSARDLALHGLGWPEAPRERPYDRLPSVMREALPETTWWLGKQSAGVAVDFRTRATTLEVRWTVEPVEDHPRDPYMPECGRGGVDLYGRDGAGRWRWVGAQKPGGESEGRGTLTKEPLDGVEREYRLYLPLMRRVLSLEIGSEAPMEPVEPDPRPPVLYYGTSIVQGAGVSRPGCGHVQLLERALDVEILNLGFCGRAHCEPAKAELFARQPARLILLDVLPNNGENEIGRRLPPFLEILLAAHDDIPVLLMEERLFGDAAFLPGRGRSRTAKNRALHEVVLDFRRNGHSHLHIVPMNEYYGEDGSTDANHPNDLGAHRLFERLLPAVTSYL